MNLANAWHKGMGDFTIAGQTFATMDIVIGTEDEEGKIMQFEHATFKSSLNNLLIIIGVLMCVAVVMNIIISCYDRLEAVEKKVFTTCTVEVKR